MTATRKDQTVGAQVRKTAANNPTTATAAVGIVLQGVGALLHWDPTVQAAVAQITLGTCVLTRLAVLAWKEAGLDP